MDILYKIKEYLLPDPVFRKPRIWSNRILSEIAPTLTGRVINISGWDDRDKQGRHYRDYFTGATTYDISNFESAMGFQGKEGEIYLDLTKPLPQELVGQYDVVFNHTTLEHIFDVDQAFTNLCALSRRHVVIVVPWLQPLHYDEGYKDYWRLSPFALDELFKKNGFKTVINTTNSREDSVYVFAVGTKL